MWTDEAKTKAASFADLPAEPAVYALAGEGARRPAYVGIGEKLSVRVKQHLVRRDSSVATGTSAAGINVDQIREVVWWEHPRFTKQPSPTGRRDDRPALEAAERIAERLLDPILRSQGRPSREALERESDPEFVRSMEDLFGGQPSGRLVLPTLASLADELQELKARIAALEGRTSESPYGG